MKDILKWQYDQMVKELLLLQEHRTDKRCPCASDGERCARKHLMTVEAYAQETLAMEEADERKLLLQQLGAEAKQRREQEEAALCDEDAPPQDAEWIRSWRKKLEDISLDCGVAAPEQQEES